MNKKNVLPILLISTSMLCLTLVFAVPKIAQNNQEINQSSQESSTRAAPTKDLISTAGEKILEMTEASYQSTENSLDSSSCRVKNLSGKYITAVGLVWTVTFSDGMTWQTEQLVDYRIHKDIADAKGARPFAPYEEKVIPRLTKESFNEGQSIENVKVEIVFVEFESSDGVGIENSETYKQLLLKREGAEIYKRWLEDIYQDDPKKINRIVEKLSSDELPNDKKLKDSIANHGALIYKKWMLGVLKDKGADSLQQVLKRK